MIFAKEFAVKTGARFDLVDVTDDVRSVVTASGVVQGSVLVFCPHTTCCVLLGTPSAELAASLSSAMEALAPEGAYYAHDDLTIRTENLVEDEPANAPAHVMNAVMGKVSESVPVAGGDIVIGDDQKILFVELDSSRPRRYLIQVTGE
ncbi:MAG TPA: secondary thiamine-phosphate synthase enzyme YjbQ [Actinomycetota bacterium]|nr:secondary thiamine-phosphate synthase enzyme YjbQ [Actinomycetota bacterium]